MEIDVSIIILIIAIVGANFIVLVKIFYKDEEDEEDEKKGIRKEFPAVSKFWEEPMDDSQKKLLNSAKNDLNTELARKNNGLISDKIANGDIEEELDTKKSEYEIKIAKNNLKENENANKQKIEEKIDNKNSEVVEIIIEGKIYELTLKDNIIFSYNNEKYSSYVLDIKHNNIKIKYRSQEKWINFSDIRKIL